MCELKIITGMALCALSISSAHALDEPNDNYSSLILSFRSQSFSDPVCIGNECHTGWAGPAAVFSQQVIPNLALGLSGSYLQSSGASSSLTSTGIAVFVEAIAGVGSSVDIGASVAALDSKVQMSSSNPAFSSSVHDTGNDVGVFGKIFLTDTRSVSVTLSYDAISYQKASSQSVVGVSLVTIMAKHHRFALSVDRVRDSNGKLVSGGAGFGYSYLF